VENAGFKCRGAVAGFHPDPTRLSAVPLPVDTGINERAPPALPTTNPSQQRSFRTPRCRCGVQWHRLRMADVHRHKPRRRWTGSSHRANLDAPHRSIEIRQGRWARSLTHRRLAGPARTSTPDGFKAGRGGIGNTQYCCCRAVSGWRRDHCRSWPKAYQILIPRAQRDIS
jgi:hypothetical protein